MLLDVLSRDVNVIVFSVTSEVTCVELVMLQIVFRYDVKKVIVVS